MDGSIAPDGATADTWTVAGRTFQSRLIVGTGRYKDLEETGRAIEAIAPPNIIWQVKFYVLPRALSVFGVELKQ